MPDEGKEHAGGDGDQKDGMSEPRVTSDPTSDHQTNRQLTSSDMRTV